MCSHSFSKCGHGEFAFPAGLGGAQERDGRLGGSGRTAASRSLATVKHVSRLEASLAARVAGRDAPARGGWRRLHGDR